MTGGKGKKRALPSEDSSSDPQLDATSDTNNSDPAPSAPAISTQSSISNRLPVSRMLSRIRSSATSAGSSAAHLKAANMESNRGLKRKKAKIQKTSSSKPKMPSGSNSKSTTADIVCTHSFFCGEALFKC
jgi:hypothetical protein